MRSGRLKCGDVITRTTTLTADVGPCAGTAGIIIGADKIMLNLNGHTVFGVPGSGAGNDGGIRLPNRSGVTITGQPGNSGRMGTVTGFDAGVVVNGGSGNTIENLNVRDNVGPLDSNATLGDGIVLFHSSDNRIIGNVVTRNGRFDGIGVLGLGADNNEIRGNTVEDNVGISEAESPPVAGIPHYINAPGHGIVVNHFLDQPFGTEKAIYGNTVMNNSVRRNEGSGISTVANINGVIVGNVVEDNAAFYYGNFFRLYEPYAPSSVVGIGVTTSDALLLKDDGGTNALVANNVVNRNAIVGIHMRSSGNQVRDNQVFDNGSWGINVDYESRNNEILHNRTGGNLMVDLLDQSGEEPPCSTNRWWDNTYSDEVQPLGVEFGFPAPYYPDCTAAGP
jgi:parallel beta-helix repeat protein